MAMASINIPVDHDVKQQAQELFESLGMDMATKKPQLGCMKGKIWEADDHDWFEPLEDFKEYM